MKFSSKTDFHGVYRNVGGFIAKKNETFIQANIVSNMQNKNYICTVPVCGQRGTMCGSFGSIRSFFIFWMVCHAIP